MICDRCDGDGKVVLFTSAENPCKKCGGSGQVNAAQNPVPKPTTAPSHASLMQEFFKNQIGRKLLTSEFAGTQLSNPPTVKDAESLVADFEATYIKRVGPVASSIPMSLLKSKGPQLFFRRDTAFKVSFTHIAAQGYHYSSCWNNSQSGWDLPTSTLVVLVSDPVIYARYYWW